MFAILSPAKSLDFSEKELSFKPTEPLFEKETKELVSVMKEKSTKDIKDLMGVSDNLAELNYERYQDFYNQDEKPAIYAFQGDVYKGLQAEDFDDEQLKYAQNHIGVLSGLYGLLRPFDVMRAYRLEMGTKLENKNGKDLYEFWNGKVTIAVNDQLRKSNSTHVVNLASNEYYKVLQPKELDKPVLDIVFKEIKGDKPPRIISFFAKKARGLMAKHMAEVEAKTIDDLKSFDKEGYYFEKDASNENALSFYRKHEE